MKALSELPPAVPPDRLPNRNAAPNVVSGRPVKHSLTLRGHRTSVSLEVAFWEEFRRLALVSGRSLNDLAAEIDAGRADVGLASAIRVHVLHHLRAERADDAAPDPV